MAKDSMQQLLVSAAAKKFGKLNENTDWSELSKSMTRILKIDPDNLFAVRYKMIADYRLLAKKPDPSSKYIRSILDCAEKIINNSTNNEMIRDANQITVEIKNLYNI